MVSSKEAYVKRMLLIVLWYVTMPLHNYHVIGDDYAIHGLSLGRLGKGWSLVIKRYSDDVMWPKWGYNAALYKVGAWSLHASDPYSN
jgi:hypothetical protein